MRRYYIERTGSSGDLDTGIILNKDGTEYTGEMTEAQSISIPSTLKIEADGFDVEITVAQHDDSGKHAKVCLTFTQDVGEEVVTIAKISLRGYQLTDLSDLLKDKIKKFNNNLS